MAGGELISVIIPVFNCERYIEESIRCVLQQDYEPIEILVVDNGSTDASVELARRFEPRVTLLYQPDRGIAPARNAGVEAANGDFLAFQDADDRWSTNKLSLQMERFEATPDLDMVFTLVRQFISPELDEETRSSIVCEPEIMKAPAANSMLVKSDSFRKVGLFDIQWKVGEFMDWYARAMELKLNGCFVDEVLTERRLHTSNTVTREREAWTDYVKILKHAMDRRKKSTS